MTKPILCAIFVASFLGGNVHAQTSLGTTTTTTTASSEATGTIKEYTPGSLLVLETLAPNEPMQFKLSKTVAYADTDGKTVEAAGLATNRRVRVHFTRVGGDNVADKITLIGN